MRQLSTLLCLLAVWTCPAHADDAASQKTQDWNLHGQMTVIEQAYPSFQGVNGLQSLDNRAQNKETMSTTLFGGVRLPWSDEHTSTEFYVNPEYTQGFGLSNTVGVAGFPNGEGAKAGQEIPRLDWARFFMRQVFGLGGEREDVESDANQLGGSRDIDRVTFSMGKMAVTDFFDNNSYSHDARSQFLNWALIDAGAYDYAADPKGYTGGAVVELNEKEWALRYGYFLMPIFSNSRYLEENWVGKGSHNLELEERYVLGGQKGVLRLLGYANIAHAGSYHDALMVPDFAIAETRATRTKDGVVINIEQAITDDLGLFSRASWNNGQDEIISFTDIDQSFSAGMSLKGTSWNRADDTVGAAGVINGLTKAHIDYLKAGGTGILIGDGSMNYAPEEIIETYYNVQVIKQISTMLDYQFINNPAYNQNRGPVHVFAIRAHAEF